MKIVTIIILISTAILSCSQSQNLGPGYEFDLFKNTSNWQLAQAVDEEDTNAISNILKISNVSIDFQEPQYGNTVLSLAVSNGKLLSVKTLLEHGANINLKDSDHFAAIHAATDFITLRNNAPQILKLLLEYGANPNMVTRSSIGYDTSHFYVTLMGAINNLKCTKLLLQYGANLYCMNEDNYPVWSQLLILDAPMYENISKYLIVENHMKIPNPIFYSVFPKHHPVGALELLRAFKVYRDPKKRKSQDRNNNILKKIKFPRTWGILITSLKRKT